MLEHYKALLLWREPVVSENNGPPFPPTFKLDVPGPGYSKKRVPAWTDRVLFRSQHAEPLTYGSVEQAKVLSPARNISDHNPVFARFEVDCVTVNSGKLSRLIREVRRNCTGTPTSNPCERRAVEQALAFQANLMEVAQPEIEDLARRLFADLQELGTNEEVMAGATQLLDFQEECSPCVQQLGGHSHGIPQASSCGGWPCVGQCGGEQRHAGDACNYEKHLEE